MLAFTVRRLGQMLPTMVGVVLLLFGLFNWVGGDPAYLLAGKMADADAIAAIRRQLGVDQPYYVQLWIFMKQVATLDFGLSWATGEPVSALIASRLGPSLAILAPLTVLETVLGVALALAVAFRRGTLTDRALMLACTVGMSISILVYIIVFQYGLAYRLGWFPVQGWGGWRYAVLPVLIGLAVSLAPTLRLFRSFVLDEAGQDYVRTARAKGLSERRVLWVHVLRNAAIPILTHVMANLPALLIGAFLLERFFGIPGIGREVILAVERSDFPVIKAITVYVAAATMVFNLLADLLYQAVDPRVRLA
ncbi:peptide/nickel transport system permease protein [Duganella sp. 1224]|uniref:ABC transporter permease n=1 Tax=Duganella sp. 1224 TaxID=2587052 RepID=UPI0015CCBE1E|nr:ABC transporter permease [Duganella sp. 1224]NYE62496.1 peptide/nickel transport system permease protein [Duganella sp. 1224]